LTIGSGSTVMVQPGCHIPTIDHFITADDSEELEVHSTWLDWTMTLSQLFDHNDSNQITNIVQELRNPMSREFEITQGIRLFR
jgi:hypothetical protein